MLRADIKVGEEYALRERSSGAASLQRVRILAYVRGGKWKAEWIDPDPGLVHYVESGHLVAPWKDRTRFLSEEEQRRALAAHNARTGYRKDSAVASALTEVLESTGDEVTFHNGSLTGSPEALERVRTRACVSETSSPFVYTARSGALHLPFDEALAIAQHFCAAEPTTVLQQIEATEREWSSDVQHHGEAYLLKLLNEYRAAWALIRQWAGLDAAVGLREQRIQELERLVWDAVYALQKAGDERAAARLRAALQGRAR